ncbi:UvrD-helicase domain-containing protein [Dokdonella immobilis]|nr:UvrD-helicase domain-containing protein [Dokdonella immobilis]
MAGIDEDRFWLRIEGQPDGLLVHLVQVRAVRIEAGLLWATCYFDLQRGEEKFTRTVDGIPNEHAHQMQASITMSVIDAIARFVTAKTSELELWLDRAMMSLKSAPGVVIAGEAIHRALEDVRPPATPGDIPWGSILWHSEAPAARPKAQAWPTWQDPPSIELEKRFRAHNAATFKQALGRWYAAVTAPIGRGRWIPKGEVGRLLVKNPAPHWPGRSWKETVGDASPETTLRHLYGRENEKHLAYQKEFRGPFFDSVEKNPLTEEQIHACVCMDDSVMVVAAAGSGKTSTMVAKTGYVLLEKLAEPEQILLLAFNRATADEVGRRIAEQLRGMPSVDRVRSNTFHAFGIDIIGKATGRTPSLAPWLDPNKSGADVRKVAEIIESLGARDKTFKRDWDLFRTVYARDIGKWGVRQEPDTYRNGRRGFDTAGGQVVKSKEERIIANWLFYHRINYEYERRYEHDTADSEHQQYVPDFYYPGVRLYHEHFALNARGEAPPHFENYKEGVAWKRRIHAEKSTDFIETTSGELASGRAIKKLKRELIKRGLKPTFDPQRPAPGMPPVSEMELSRSFRVFQQHVKNNGLTHSQLQAALNAQSREGYAARLRMFLALYERISEEWERLLKEGGYIDFEDMLIQAAEHVEEGRYQSPYTVILADEYQDSSRARVRLLKALAASPSVPTHLCVVGDDWQGINRFAGSDISVMREFESIFGYATRLTLNTTFRCPNDVCEASSAFIQVNPAQISKVVSTTNPLSKTPLLAFGLQSQESIVPYIEQQLEDMHRYAADGKLRSMSGSHVTVKLLGRYQNDRPSELADWIERFGDRLKIDFSTVHGSKGLEAEYVFVLNVVQGTRGFPSQIQDDPALQLAMPEPDPFPFAEERRLFYVAMTRARKQVRFYTTLGQPSQFLVELVASGHLAIEPVDGDPLEPCPRCQAGVLLQRQGPRGPFLGCSRFPACEFSQDMETEARPLPTLARTSRIRFPVSPGDPCPVCRTGTLIKRAGRNGDFIGCSRYRQGCGATASIR